VTFKGFYKNKRGVIFLYICQCDVKEGIQIPWLGGTSQILHHMQRCCVINTLLSVH